jgi:putative hydrolase of the HAD superfamily
MAAMASRHRPIAWTAIDTVLIDMDGTLLDLKFDNWFWLEHVPARWAAARGVALDAAARELMPRFDAARGRLDWYCVDYWSRELDLDIGALAEAESARVAWIPGAAEFLARLGALGKERLLLTNAHPVTLAIKDRRAEVVRRVDAAYSSHAFGAPKEDPAFWPRFAAAHRFDPERTLLIDDSLAVLGAAREAGIGWQCAILKPDSGRPARTVSEFHAVEAIAELA